MRMRCTVLLGLGIAVACAKPPVDPNGELLMATPIEVGELHSDELACERRKNDCTDWFKFVVADKGDLAVTVLVDASPDADNAVSVELRDKQGTVIDQASVAGPETRIATRIARGTYFVTLGTLGKQAVPYRLRTSFDDAPAVSAKPPKSKPKRPQPPKVRYETRTGNVLELEDEGGSSAVLLGIGEAQGIRAGQEGRLVEGGRELAAIVIEEVFPDGSRARIRGELSAPITPRTKAEIRVPLEVPRTP